MVPNPFGHQGLVPWKTIFSWARWWGWSQGGSNTLHILCSLFLYHSISSILRSSGIRSQRLGIPAGRDQSVIGEQVAGGSISTRAGDWIWFSWIPDTKGSRLSIKKKTPTFLWCHVRIPDVLSCSRGVPLVSPFTVWLIISSFINPHFHKSVCLKRDPRRAPATELG